MYKLNGKVTWAMHIHNAYVQCIRTMHIHNLNEPAEAREFFILLEEILVKTSKGVFK